MRSRSDAFTLVELLSVVAILALMIGLLPRLLAPSGGVALQQTSSALGGLFQSARTLAILQGVRTSVRFHGAASDLDQYLRYAVVAYEKDGVWTAVNAGYRFSSGILFDPARSVLSSGEDPAPPVEVTWASKVGSNGSQAVRWFSYEFGNNGVLASPEAQVVVSVGRVGVNGEVMMDTAKSGGFWLNQSGAQSYFESEGDILE